MATARFTESEWQKLLRFKGYGNPSGRFWFTGIEERGEGSPEELAVRLKFREIEDLLYAQSPEVWGKSPLWGDFDPDKLIPTWSTMIKILLRLRGNRSWANPQAVREYQLNKFGRLDGETFLTELLPLPKPADTAWPDWWPWPSWNEYEAKVLPGRLRALRKLFDAHAPHYVFCYGKGYWSYHNQLFGDASFKPIVGGKMKAARLDRSRIVLTPFFAWYLMPNALIDAMARELQV